MVQKFLRCNTCGNMVAMVNDSGVDIICCGKPMEVIQANTTDGSVEKHVPVYAIENNKVHVRVGSADHPMTEEHYIQWISIQTNKGNQRKELKYTDKPAACFAICDGEKIEAVYAYCNIHGLWKA